MPLKYDKDQYRSACSVACALDILGDKWTLLIIRDALMNNSTSFGEFRRAPEKIASNILSNRLEKLVTVGIMEKCQNPVNKLKFDYTLTERGRQLKPILLALADWAGHNIEGCQTIPES